MSIAPWGEAHRREALRRTYEISAEFAASGKVGIAWHLSPPSPNDGIVSSAEIWSAYLATVGTDGRQVISDARIEREVRRVRALAESRLVRELPIEGYHIAFPDGGRSNIVTRQQARDGIDPMRKGEPDPHGRRVVPVRVTRIRRAP